MTAVENGEAAPRVGWRKILVEPARPKWIAQKPNAYWYAVITVCFGAFMGQLDASIVTLAFPTMGRDFHATVGAVQWVGLSYLLMLVGALAAVGRYADMVGRKLLYTYGFLIFILGSALCGFAVDLPMLIGFRVLQAGGAAMLQANSVAIIVGAMPSEKLGRGIGVQGAAQALGLALGPAVGGALISLGGWRLIFFVNVPVGLAATILAWFLIPRSRHLAQKAPFDWIGLAFFAPAAIAFMLAISLGNHLGWLSPLMIVSYVVAIVFLVAFLVRESRTRYPMLDLALMKIKAFWMGIASGWLIYLIIFGVLFVVPYFLEDGMHLSPGRTGVELLAMPFAIGIFAPFAGNLADRLGPKPLLIFGMSLSTISLAFLAFNHHNIVFFLIELFGAGAGLGLSTAPNNAATMGAIPKESSGVGSGVLNMARGLGTALGLALTGLVFTLFAKDITSSALVSKGFKYSILFLALIAALVVVISIVRDNGAISSDPTVNVE